MAVSTLVSLGVQLITTAPWSTTSWREDEEHDNEQNPLSGWGLLLKNGMAIGIADITPACNWLRGLMKQISVCSIWLFFDNSHVSGGVGVLLHWLLHHWLTHWLLHHWLLHWHPHWLLHHRLTHWLLHHWLHWRTTHWCTHHLLLWNGISVLVNHRLLHWHRLHFYILNF